MTDDDNITKGQLLEGRYRLLERIADGGMATVYKAMDERLERVVAIKVMHTQLAQGPQREQFVERFHREARSAAAIANPHIVQVYDTGEWNGLNFLVMEYVHGVNLRHEMDVHGTFDVRETVRIISQTLDGLASAWRSNVIHRDIKPENILINDRGHVQITDFGLARAVSQATVSTTGMLLGTAAYLAPEIIEENRATPQGDLYAVGIMMWEMLVGEVPFRSDNPVTMLYRHAREEVPALADVCPGIDSQISEFVSHLVQRNLDARPKDAAQALMQLQDIGSSLSAEAWGYRTDPSGHKDSGNSSTAATSGIPATSATTAMPAASPTSDAASTSADASSADSPQPATQRPSPSSSTEPSPDQTVPPQAPSEAMLQSRSIANDGRYAQNQETQTIDLARTSQIDASALAKSASDGDLAQVADAPQGTHNTKQTNRGRHHSRAPWIVTLVVFLVLALCGAGFGWWYFLGPGSYWELPRPDGLRCSGEGTSCTISDVPWKTYKKTLAVAGIPYKVSRSYSDTVKNGNVIATSPKTVGSRVSKRNNAKLTVTISRGVRQATVPGDIDDPASANGKDPVKALSQAGFTNVLHDESKDTYSQTLPAGALQNISADPGTTLNHNVKITLELSKGPMPVSMPDVVGKSKDEAQSAFSDARLKASYTEEFSDSVPAGDVIAASVQQGTQMHWGDSVSVRVSKGPETVTVPDVKGKSTDEAKKTLESLGLSVKISAPLGDIAHTVRLQSPDPGQQVTVRDKNGNKTVITLTVI